ncbi:amidase family protein [Furfurilactobacillus entadae]|uniref:amidase family protein n=1 Tax=Furfurilactobacillus entadae TaxID=2922307 RepID=UPI0035E5A200
MRFIKKAITKLVLSTAVIGMIAAPIEPAFASDQPTGTEPTTTAVQQPAETPQETTATPIKQSQSAETTTTPPQTQPQSAVSMANDVRNGTTTSTALVNQTLTSIDQSNPTLNDVITVRKDAALQDAKADDATPISDRTAPFYGVPILVKGLTHTVAGEPNTNGLPFEAGNVTNFDSRFVKKMKDLGFVVVGQTNFPELGLFNVTNSNLYGAASNPWDVTRNPGGSSGGAAAAVANGTVPIALANDEGGSIRIPASWTGVVGLKPTQGILAWDSKTIGAVNFAETRTMADTETLFNALRAKPGTAPLLSDLKQVPVAYSLTSPVGTPVSDDAKAAVLNTVAFLRKQGFTVVEKAAPVDGVQLMKLYYESSTATGSIANYLFNQKFHRNLIWQDVVNKQVSPITYALYQASLKQQQADPTFTTRRQTELTNIAAQMSAFHKEYPLYLTPTTATVAPKNMEPIVLPADVDRIETMASLPFDQQMALIYDAWLYGLSKTPFTQLANLSGEPAISLPTYVTTGGLPLGVQFEAGRDQDDLLMALGTLFEQAGLFKEWPQPTQQPEPTTNGNGQSAPNSQGGASAQQQPTTSRATNPGNPEVPVMKPAMAAVATRTMSQQVSLQSITPSSTTVGDPNDGRSQLKPGTLPQTGETVRGEMTTWGILLLFVVASLDERRLKKVRDIERVH